MTATIDLDLQKLRTVALSASQGRWWWGGHDTGSIELLSGTRRIVTTMGGQPCTYYAIDETVGLTVDACDSCIAEAAKKYDPFVDYDGCERSAYAGGTIWLSGEEGWYIKPANEWAVREVPYRSDVVDVNHPDARHIATFDPETVLALLDEIERLTPAPSADMDCSLV